MYIIIFKKTPQGLNYKRQQCFINNYYNYTKPKSNF